MQIAFTEEQNLIRDTAAAFFREHGSGERVRRVVDSAAGYDENVWRMIGDMGWTGIMLPEIHGGAGLGMIELAIVQEQMGRCLYPSPFFSTVCLAAPAIALAGTAAQKSELLPGIAAGATRATLVMAEAPLPLARRGNEWILSGQRTHVIYGHVADLYIVAVRARGSSGDDGVSLLALPASTPGLHAERLVMMDLTRPMSRVTFTDVVVSGDQILGVVESSGAALATTLQLAAIALAAEQTGAAQAALEITTDYVKQRVQFGRPIGSFQAVKHRLADMLVRIEAAKSAMCYAAWVAAEDVAQLPWAAATAKAYCSETLVDCAAEMIQLHGGIGFTWEHAAHLYFKRAKASSTLLGTPQFHRERLATLLGLDTAAEAP